MSDKMKKALAWSMVIGSLVGIVVLQILWMRWT